MAKSKEQVDVSTNKLTVKDVDTLLKLFQKLKKSSDLPTKNNSLWKQCEEEAEEELCEKLKKQQSRFTHPPGKNISVHTKQTDYQQKASQQGLKELILAGAEKIYREKDRAYAEVVKRKKKDIPVIVKDIDRTLYPIRELLLKFGRTEGTLLEADFRQIMDFFSAENMTLPKIQYLVEKTIDALEPIKIKLKRQQTNGTPAPKTPENGGNKTPNDLIDLAKAVSKFHRSRVQLKRDIKNREIKSYRKKSKGKHYISESEASETYLTKDSFT